MITIRYLGPIRRPSPSREQQLDLPESVTASELLDRLGYPERDKTRISVHLNGHPAKPSDVVRDGDQVTLGVLAGGG